ncbi:SDR family NAD(P)-dependent oxidoreductase [Pseudokineococcus sp. 1T1Z-3]|uniref:SDR family NAD(P)-dependent oxidoreductase n=1 Tax=Pseudokineococcus sp. 1T1Z-3 TaxID=3132745 RepID=UPI0030AEAF47
MDLELVGKRALVSGSTQGIGYAVASALAAEGAAVVLHGRSRPRVEEAVARLRDRWPEADVTGVAGDLAVPSEVEQLLDQVGPGGVDVLVNNAGLFEVKEFDLLTDEDWRLVHEVNVLGAVRLSRRLLPGMLSRGWGRVICVSSESGVDVPADMLPYGVSKAALLAFANGLAKLTRGTEVTVNSVLGGPTYSDGVAAAVRSVALQQGMPEEDLRTAIGQRRTTSLVQRFLEPAELASLVTYLASPLSSATNGAALRADGGVLTQVL